MKKSILSILIMVFVVSSFQVSAQSIGLSTMVPQNVYFFDAETSVEINNRPACFTMYKKMPNLELTFSPKNVFIGDNGRNKYGGIQHFGISYMLTASVSSYLFYADQEVGKSAGKSANLGISILCPYVEIHSRKGFSFTMYMSPALGINRVFMLPKDQSDGFLIPARGCFDVGFQNLTIHFGFNKTYYFGFKNDHAKMYRWGTAFGDFFETGLKYTFL